jgi:hypothetical protein
VHEICVRGGTSKVAAFGLRCGRAANRYQEASYVLMVITALFREAGRAVSADFSFALSSLPYSSSLSSSSASRWCVCFVMPSQLWLSHPHFQWIQPPDILIGANNSTVRFGRNPWPGTRLTQHIFSRQLSRRASTCCQTGSKSIWVSP